MNDFNLIIFEYGMKILASMLVLVVGFYIVSLLLKMVDKALKKSKVDVSLHSFIRSLVSFGLKVIVFITTAGMLGIPSTTFITVLGSAGLAIGLALKDSLSNFAGGVLLLTFRPFSVGHYIETQGVGGTVQDIQLLYTHLNTPDNRRVLIPNGELANAKIINFSIEAKRRVELVFGVAHNSDTEKVKEILSGIVNAHPMVIGEPEPLIRMQSHKENALEFTVKVWCLKEDYWSLYYDLHETVKEEFDRNHIKLPSPLRNIHILSEGRPSDNSPEQAKAGKKEEIFD